jgi:hypothetical protein
LGGDAIRGRSGDERSRSLERHSLADVGISSSKVDQGESGEEHMQEHCLELAESYTDCASVSFDDEEVPHGFAVEEP